MLDAHPSADRFFEIPEMLSEVFSRGDRKSNVVNAQVSKMWSELALDCLWRNVDKLHHLFNILVPMTRSPGTMNYVRRSQNRTRIYFDWERLNNYSPLLLNLLSFSGRISKSTRDVFVIFIITAAAWG